MLPTFWTFGVLCCLLGTIPSSAYQRYSNRIPNGDRIPHPCIEGEIWEGVGHMDRRGGGPRNPFGIDFKETGNYQWTVELCLLDSDADGFTNGEELGDPDCLWTEGDSPQRTTSITHPGVCNPFNNEICAGRSTFVTCENIEPENKLYCKNLNRTEVFAMDYSIPRTRIPRKASTYLCHNFNAPIDQNYYLIGMEPLIDNENIMHHILVYGCPDSTPIKDEPIECTMGSLCTEIIGVWTVGFPGLCLPSDVGFLFGPRGYKTIQFEFHWDNSQMQDNQYDASGMRLHFEPARSGMITAGVILMGSIMLHIPPHQSRHEEHGGCDGECTSQFWRDSLNVFGGVNQMHYIGVEQRTSLWRDGTKIRDIAYDSQDSMNNPIFHRFDPPLVVWPGDKIKTTCVYDSSDRQRATYYGEGTKDEMCFFFTFYYPKENSKTSYCNTMGPLSQCERNAGTPIGNCDWSYFINGVVSQSLPVAQDLQYNCILTGQCQPECRVVVEELKLHPCMQDDIILFISTRMRNSLEGVRFLARYSSCADDICQVPTTAGPNHGLRPALSKGVLMMAAIFMFVL